MHNFLDQLQLIIKKRQSEMPAGSYTTTLFSSGLDRILQKVGEESIEVILAAKQSDPQALKDESADLIFHFLVLLAHKAITLDEIIEVLEKRHSN